MPSERRNVEPKKNVGRNGICQSIKFFLSKSCRYIVMFFFFNLVCMLNVLSAGHRLLRRSFRMSERCTGAPEPPPLRRGGEIDSPHRGEIGFVRAKSGLGRGGETWRPLGSSSARNYPCARMKILVIDDAFALFRLSDSRRRRSRPALLRPHGSPAAQHDERLHRLR